MTKRMSVLLILALVAAFLFSLLVPHAPLATLIHTEPALVTDIVVELRLPRTMLALVYGAVLGASGAAIQALFANPLASPDLTGTTSGAAFGAVITAYILGFSGPFALAAGAVTGAFTALALLLLLTGARAETASLLLAGLAISALAGALTTLALALAPSPFAFYDAYEWLMGSLIDRSLDQAVFAAIPALLTIFMLLRFVPALDSLALGEEVAQSLGHDIRRMRLWIVFLTCLGVGACVAVCGAIGFIGLVAPVFARRLTGGHPGQAVLPAAMIGGLLLLGADLLSRSAPVGRLLPVGVITALLGAPFFLWLVAQMRWKLSR